VTPQVWIITLEPCNQRNCVCFHFLGSRIEERRVEGRIRMIILYGFGLQLCMESQNCRLVPLQLVHAFAEIAFVDTREFLIDDQLVYHILCHRKHTETPLSIRKHLNPLTPASTRGIRSPCAALRHAPKQTDAGSPRCSE
jgi:hypothetical protein